jgi:hypothetical protein
MYLKLANELLIIINYSAYLAIGQGRRFSKLNQRPRHRWALLGLKFGAIYRFDFRKLSH